MPEVALLTDHDARLAGYLFAPCPSMAPDGVILRFRRDDLPSRPMDVRRFNSASAARSWASEASVQGYLLGFHDDGRTGYWFEGVVGDFAISPEEDAHILLMTDPCLNEG